MFKGVSKIADNIMKGMIITLLVGSIFILITIMVRLAFQHQ